MPCTTCANWRPRLLAIAFTALLLITGERFIEDRLQHEAMTAIVAMATLPP